MSSVLRILSTIFVIVMLIGAFKASVALRETEKAFANVGIESKSDDFSAAATATMVGGIFVAGYIFVLSFGLADVMDRSARIERHLEIMRGLKTEEEEEFIEEDDEEISDEN